MQAKEKNLQTTTPKLTDLSVWLSNPFILQTATKYSTSFVMNLANKIPGRFPKIERLVTEGLDALEEKLAEYNQKNSMIQNNSEDQHTQTQRG